MCREQAFTHAKAVIVIIRSDALIYNVQTFPGASDF